ncbi:MAG: type IV pilus modification protein PilV [Betaproteobacteria bacterium]
MFRDSDLLRARRTTRRQRGASLVEVLVSLFLVAVSMLGLLSLQLNSLAFQRESLDLRAAATIAEDFLDRVASNPAGVRAGNYDLEFNRGVDDDEELPTAPSCGSATSICNEAQIAARDLRYVAAQVAARLPGGAAYVVTDGGVRVTVFVGWVDPKRTQQLSGLPAGQDLAVDPNCPQQIGELDDEELRLRFRCFQASTF